MKLFFEKIKPFVFIGGFYVLVSFILRCIFVFHPITTASFGVEVLKLFTLGVISDVFVFVLGSSFLALYFLFLSNEKYKKPYGGIIFGAFLLSILYVKFVPNNIFKQYGGSVEEIALIFLSIKTFCFGLLLFLPKYRQKLRNGLYFITLFLYSLVIVQNAVSEYFFWNEFGIRYNFIAVDYLIYTNEVIGNIMESYPIIPLFSLVFLITLVATIFLYKKTKNTLLSLPNFFEKSVLLISFLLISGVSLLALPKLDAIKGSNIFATEIQANGIYKFYYAFTHSELNYFDFYPVVNKPMPKTAVTYFGKESVSQENKKNVVLISVESLSAEFMKAYGNSQNITPFLDSLANKSLFFTNLYATGNRTVRGLEALTLCLPPTPGESIVKRKDNKNKFTTGGVFQEKGYQVKYLYGGYSYFDNMKDFFGGNGYQIIDRDHFQPEKISFANVWGVCDEDMANKAIEVMNADAQTGKPFFHHWMTVSNHRPFTYPNGKIDIPGDAKSREGGVKYTDYAIKQFFKMAQKQAWFQNTIFVIVADHCASSAGKTDLPLDRYRIPAFIYAPNGIQPQKFTKLMSQIDVMPTLFGLLNFQFSSKFIGENVLSETYQPRAYMATYQDLGYLKDDVLTIISPLKKIKQFKIKQQPSEVSAEFRIFYDEIPQKNIQKKYAEACIYDYQRTAFLLKNNLLNRK